ncbi:MAG: AI-2E family transporter [Phenylobacterium zucineum]|nr:MAG: AI-2E family transporter [Phenylobacterium zucineum]
MRRPDPALKPSPDDPAPPRQLSLLQLGALAVLGLLIWRLSDVVMMAFGAVLVAALIHALAGPLIRRLGLPRPAALIIAVAGLALAIAATVWLFGQQLAIQLVALGDLLPRAWAALQQQLSTTTIGAYVLDDLQRLKHPDGMVVEQVSRIVRSSASATAASVIVLFAGLYLAFSPGAYLNGALRLLPMRRRARAAEVLHECGHALHGWLIGSLISMVVVGVSVGLGLWIAGVPSPLALGMLAGIAQFIPVIGPMAATIPGLIVAAGDSPEALFWASVIYVGSSQFEANLITPLLLRQMVELPMAVTLFAVLAMGVLFGPLGVIFATPLAVVAYVTVRRVYVEDVLGDRLS